MMAVYDIQAAVPSVITPCCSRYGLPAGLIGQDLNAALLVAPHQLQRRPRRPIEENCLEFAREIAQGVAEIRALTGWLLDEGCPSVGLMGFSFGGWLAGLTACSDARIASAVLTVPGVRMRCTQPVVWRRVRESRFRL